MAKTYQIMNVSDHGHNYVCIYDSTANYNPYKLYRKWYDKGWHRKKVAEYCEFQSILWHLLQAEYGVR